MMRQVRHGSGGRRCSGRDRPSVQAWRRRSARGLTVLLAGELIEGFLEFEVDGGESDGFGAAGGFSELEPVFVDEDADDGGVGFGVGVVGVEGYDEFEGFVGECFADGLAAFGVALFGLGSAFVVCFGGYVVVSEPFVEGDAVASDGVRRRRLPLR